MDFISPDPKAVVRAANVRATLAAFKLLPDLGRKLVERHALPIDDLQPDSFIPVQNWLNALKEIQQTIGPNKVREVGRNIVENADFPPTFADAEAILLALDQIYYLNHRGNVGHYRVAREDDGSLTVRCETPYPRMFEWGLVEGITRNRRGGGRYGVEYLPGPEAGALTCTLRVRRLGA